jgi:hypothetical protein
MAARRKTVEVRERDGRRDLERGAGCGERRCARRWRGKVAAYKGDGGERRRWSRGRDKNDGEDAPVSAMSRNECERG